MKHYDRANGRLVVAFDELANVRDTDLLKALYDFFREPVVSTFSDGKPRPMGGVTVIVTGNPDKSFTNRFLVCADGSSDACLVRNIQAHQPQFRIKTHNFGALLS